jgi:hypothetical protein
VTRTVLAALLFLSLLTVGSLWVVRYLPTNDGPESVLAVHIENHFADPGTIYSSVFRPAPQFAGRGFTILYEPLEDLLGWQRGLSVALSVLVLVNAWGLVALLRAVAPDRVPLAFLGFPLALSWPLYMGFFAFVLASGVGLVLLGASLRPMTALRRVVLGASLLLQAFLHMFPAILTGVVMLLLLVARAPRGEKWKEALKVAAMGLPALCLVLAAFLVARTAAVGAAFSEGFAFAPLLVSLVSWPRTVAPGPFGRALVVTVCLTLAVAFGVWRATRKATSATDRALALAGAALLLLGLFAPRDVPGWQCFSERFVGLGIGLTLACLPLEKVASRASLVTGGIFLAAAAWTASSYPFHRRLEEASKDAIDGLSANVVRHGIWLPVTLEPIGRPLTPIGDAEVPLLAPLRHIAALYATVEGGLTPYTFASNPATWPFAIREDAIHPPPVPPVEKYISAISVPDFQTDRRYRHGVEEELLMYGMKYEGVLLTGARPEDLVVWKKRGYVPDWEQGSVMIARFQPCPLTVVLHGDAMEGSPRVDLRAGAAVMRDIALPASGVIERAPCGLVYVRPHWEEAGGAKRWCGGLKEDGELRAILTHEGGSVVCEGKAPQD